MEIYSEYMNGDRKATVTMINRHWDNRMNTHKVWEVAMYIDGRVIQRVTSLSEPQAENLAEDFVQGSNSGPSLLNEHISNG